MEAKRVMDSEAKNQWFGAHLLRVKT